MSKKKKVKPRRRTLAPVQHASAAPSERPPETRLQRLSRSTTIVGAAALLVALAAQQKWVSLDLGAHGSTILKVAGVGMIIAGLIFGRAAKR